MNQSVAIVTGASQGIGRATAIRLANDFKSTKAHREIATATLIMDAPLAECTEDEMRLYFTDPSKLAPEAAGDFDQAKLRAGDIGKDRGGVRVRRFLEDQIVGLETERIADELERDVIVAAE